MWNLTDGHPASFASLLFEQSTAIGIGPLLLKSVHCYWNQHNTVALNRVCVDCAHEVHNTPQQSERKNAKEYINLITTRICIRQLWRLMLL